MQTLHVCLKWEFDQSWEIAKDVLMAATAGEISLAGSVFLRARGGFRNGQDEGEGPE